MTAMALEKDANEHEAVHAMHERLEQKV